MTEDGILREMFYVKTPCTKYALAILSGIVTFFIVAFGLGAIPWEKQVSLGWNNLAGLWKASIIIWTIWTLCLAAYATGHPIITIERDNEPIVRKP